MGPGVLHFQRLCFCCSTDHILTALVPGLLPGGSLHFVTCLGSSATSGWKLLLLGQILFPSIFLRHKIMSSPPPPSPKPSCESIPGGCQVLCQPSWTFPGKPSPAIPFVLQLSFSHSSLLESSFANSLPTGMEMSRGPGPCHHICVAAPVPSTGLGLSTFPVNG